jgi:hypothetical protein
VLHVSATAADLRLGRGVCTRRRVLRDDRSLRSGRLQGVLPARPVTF